jgi:hypothetical protein
LKFSFTGEVIEWRGPAPFFFVATPSQISEEIELYKRELTYGWGVIPAQVTIGSVTEKTSLIPRNGSYLVPLKNALRIPNALSLGDEVTLELELRA